MTYVLIMLGFVFLITGGNFLVAGSVAVARRLNVSALLIGLVLVGFGTSTPELLTSLVAVCKDSSGIAVGNVVGSNIANILLVLGTTAFLRPVPVQRKSFKRDSVFLIISTMVLIFALLWGVIGKFLGFLMCVTLAFYVFYSYKTEKQIKNDQSIVGQKKHTKISLLLSLAETIGGIVLTLYGAKLLVENAVLLAAVWGVDEKIVGLTVVAVGTSLPELITSIIASIKRQSELAFGNVVGSNIYNALFILGLTALFLPVKVPANVMPDIFIMCVATLLMLIIGRRGAVSRRAGALFLTLYIVYIIYLAQSV